MDPGLDVAPAGGEKLDVAFQNAIVHLYRGEVHRMTVWRSRLDTTSNWAILLTTGLATFTLGAAAVPHFILLLGLALNSICLLIEARRYQHLHHAEWRLHALEAGYFAQLLEPRSPEREWRRELALDLRDPRATIGLFLATRLRLRRNYLMLCYFVTAVWLTKVFIHPIGSFRAGELYRRLAVGDLIPSWLVAASACVFVAAITVLAAVTVTEERLETRTRTHPR